jgi:hypothetical protein
MTSAEWPDHRRVAVRRRVVRAALETADDRARPAGDAQRVDAGREPRRRGPLSIDAGLVADRRQSDLYLVSTATGVSSTRQLTFTKEKNETSPVWSNDGGFVFSSDRDAAPATAATAETGGGRAGGGGRGGRGGGGGGAAASGNQLYYMHADGGEAQKITEGAGVGTLPVHALQWLVYSAGRGEAQKALRAPRHRADRGRRPHHEAPDAGAAWQQITKDNKTIFFLSPDTVNSDEQRRTQAKFGDDPQSVEPWIHLWSLDASHATKRLAKDPGYNIAHHGLDDGKWVHTSATPDDRYQRGINEE